MSFGSRRNSLDDEQKRGTNALADSANDAVQVDETVRVLQDFINGTKFKGIDVRID